MSKRNIKNIIIILLLIVLIGMICISYAYFSSTSNSGKKEVVAGTLLINYEDDITNTLLLDNMAMIDDSEIKTKASRIGFKINNTGTSKAYVEISLTDIVMDEELSNLEFKWALYQGDTEISNGNFRNVTDNKQLLTNNIEINPGSNKSYQLYIWISESDLDQSNLMGKTFSAKITVNGSGEKSAELLSKVIKDNNPINDIIPDFSKAAVSQEYYDKLADDSYVIDQSDVVVETGLFKGEDDDG